jgi:hypothetical protein
VVDVLGVVVVVWVGARALMGTFDVIVVSVCYLLCPRDADALELNLHVVLGHGDSRLSGSLVKKERTRKRFVNLQIQNVGKSPSGNRSDVISIISTLTTMSNSQREGAHQSVALKLTACFLNKTRSSEVLPGRAAGLGPH